MAMRIQASLAGRRHPTLSAVMIVARAAVGLFVHSLAHPGCPASIARETGKVALR